MGAAVPLEIVQVFLRLQRGDFVNEFGAVLADAGQDGAASFRREAFPGRRRRRIRAEKT